MRIVACDCEAPQNTQADDRSPQTEAGILLPEYFSRLIVVAAAGGTLPRPGAAEGKKLVEICKRVKVAGGGVVRERVGNGIRKLMHARDFIAGGIDLINDAVTSAEIDSSLQQSRRPENLGCGEDLCFHGCGAPDRERIGTCRLTRYRLCPPQPAERYRWCYPS